MPETTSPASPAMTAPIVDVRTPAEFAQGRVPGAINLPLFTNDERHQVGIAYKQRGRDEAVKLGLSFVGPRLAELVIKAESIAPQKKLSLYCWRGGMRSASVSWLLRTAGFETTCLPGGYKAWRRNALNLFEAAPKFITVGGLTGVGKTDVLHALAARGECVIDLEQLANHRGSAFGKMGPQPTTEQFENEIASTLIRLGPEALIWAEDESRSIGKVFLNKPLFDALKTAPLVMIERSADQRTQLLVSHYGNNAEALSEAFANLEKRLGGQHVKAAVQLVNEGRLHEACAIALHYYDQGYKHALARSQRQPVLILNTDHQSPDEVAQTLIAWKNQHSPRLAEPRAVAAK